MHRLHYSLAILAALGLLMCLPSEPAPKGDNRREGDLAYRPSDLSFRQTPPRSTTSNRNIASPGLLRTTTPDATVPPPALPILAQPFADHFDGPKLSSDWNVTSPAWRIRDGRLCGRSARNHPVWLMRRLPKNARIAFTAESDSASGDLKVEAWGDGQSGATAVSYTNATSYLFIFGGWKNQLHVLARLNEHGADRQERRINPQSTDIREAPVAPNTQYHFQIERRDGRTVVWSVNGVEMHRIADAEPLIGTGHEHFGFNDWEVQACFDDLKITPLPN